MNQLALALLGVFLVMSVGISQAQEDIDQCAYLVTKAYLLTQSACDEVGRDQACYGNIQIQAQPDALQFDHTGDIIDLSDLESLRLSSRVRQSSEWGVALLRIQADLPDEDTSENVELLLFGNVEIENRGQIRGEAHTPVTFDVISTGNINIRSAASTDGSVIGNLSRNEIVTAQGRNAVGDWLWIRRADGSQGWVFAELIDTRGESISFLDVVSVNDVTTPVWGPMQAFYFRSGTADRPCVEAPDSGILIQTPEGAGRITLEINEAQISLGSTVFIQAQVNSDMIINVIEGHATASAAGSVVDIPQGARARIPTDAFGNANAGPIGPEPYMPATLAALPLEFLPQLVNVALPPDDLGYQLIETGPYDPPCNRC